MDTHAMINKMFDLLDEWRLLPAYQLERRADIFFALYLPLIIKDRFHVEVYHDHIIPEFPLNKKILGPDTQHPDFNLSYKVDYLVVCNEAKRIFLVELKTDTGSRRPEQDDYLTLACKKNVIDLVKGVQELQNASKSVKKYQRLIEKLKSTGLMDTSGEPTDQKYLIEKVYIQPGQDESIITFKDIVSAIQGMEDDLTKRFIASLEKWEANANKG